jgi:hypothetical protein
MMNEAMDSTNSPVNQTEVTPNTCARGDRRVVRCSNKQSQSDPAGPAQPNHKLLIILPGMLANISNQKD